MSDFRKLKTTLSYARLGLVSFAAAVSPITAAAQEICGSELFEGEPDADALMGETVAFLDVLENNGVVAFEGSEGRMSVNGARQALRDGVGSVSLLVCVVNADSVEFSGAAGSVVIACGDVGAPSLARSGGSSGGSSTGQLFCTTENATVSQYLGSES